LSGTLNNVQISNDVISPPHQTEKVSMTGNLNSNSATGDTRRTSMNIYDNVGGVHTLEYIFTKTANANEFSLSATLDGNAVVLPTTDSTIKFNADGTLATPQAITLNSGEMNTLLGVGVFDATTNINIELAPANQLISGITNYSMPNSASFSNQDGYTMGTLEDLTVDDRGQVWGAFTNGKSEVLGQVAVAQFQNQEGLVRAGDNMFVVSPNSGYPQIGTAGDIFQSTSIKANALEQSNVDIATQFTDMISTQRAFEAASRTITVSDTMLQEINNLKR
jgi:flagellar hook protein FlgE